MLARAVVVSSSVLVHMNDYPYASTACRWRTSSDFTDAADEQMFMILLLNDDV